MASSRQRLINASSFLSNQKEQIGGLNVKKSTISGDRFKKGTSLDKRVGINEKKITLLKNIGSLRKDNQKKQFNSPLLESLQSIASTVGSIRDTLIQQQDNDKGIAEDMRREKEEKERKDQEKGLEAPKPLQKIADKVIAPVMSLWSKILKFITTIFLGKILMNFLDWFGNPENQGKITTLVRFVKDWWPALVGAVLLFGTGFGGLVTGLTVAIATFIPKMLAAITALKASKLGALGGKAGLLKGGLLVGGGVLAGMGISKMMDKGDGEDVSNEKVQGLNKGGKVRGQGNKDTVPAMLTPGEFVMSKGAVEQYGVDTMESMNAAAGGTNRPTARGGYKGGAEVLGGSYSISGMPIDAFGVKSINEAQIYDEATGDTHTRYQTPEEMKALIERVGLPAMQISGGAYVPNFGKMGADNFMKGIQIIRENIQDDPDKIKILDKFMANNPYAQPDELQRVINTVVPGSEAHDLQAKSDEINVSTQKFKPQKLNKGGLVQGFQGGGLVQEYQKLKMERNRIKPGPDGKFSKEDSDRKGQLTLQMKDLYKQIQESQKSTSKIIANEKKEQEVVPAQTEDIVKKKKKLTSGSVKFTGSQLKNLLEEQKGIGSSSGILGPISSNVDAMVNTDKYEVKPKEKKNVVVAYEQEASKNQQQQEPPPAGGNDIPSFDVRPPFMTDQDKLMVLGMRV